MDLRERFDRHVFPEPNGGCHLWDGAWDEKGYGLVGMGSRLTKRYQERAHRVAWMLAYGPIPDGLGVLHKCDVRCCVNPDHLFLGTNVDNTVDMARKNRGHRSKKGLPYGVFPNNSRFGSAIRAGGKTIYLGTFDTIAIAHRIALEAKRQYYSGGS